MVTDFVTSLAAIGKYHGAEDRWYLSGIPSQDCQLPIGLADIFTEYRDRNRRSAISYQLGCKPHYFPTRHA